MKRVRHVVMIGLLTPGLVAVVAPEGVDAALSALKQHALGTHATIIGEVIEGRKGKVMLHTRLGPTRPLSTLTGELLPRIC